MSSASGTVDVADPEQSPFPETPLLETQRAGAVYRWTGTLLLGGLGFVANFLPVQLSPGTDIVFGGVLVLLAGVSYGPLSGLVAGGIAGVQTISLWGHPWGLLVMALEGGTVGFLSERRQWRPMVGDLVFWVLVGGPFLYAVTRFLLHYPLTTIGVVVLKQTLNGVFNAVLVELLLLLPFVRWALRMPGSPGLRSAIAVVVTTAAIVPALVFGIWVGRREWARSLETAENRLMMYSQAYASSLEQYLLLHENAIRSAALTIEGWGAADTAQLGQLVTILREQFPAFVEVRVSDSRVGVVAVQPAAVRPEPAPAAALLDSADLARLRTLRRTLGPGLVSDASGSVVPVVIIAHPLVASDSLAGYVLGALDLGAIPEPNIGSGDYGRLRVADGDGSLIFDSQRPAVRPDAPLPQLDPAIFAMITAGAVPATAAFTPEFREPTPALGAAAHPEILAGIAAIPGLGWWVWMEEPFSRVQSFVAESYVRLLGLLVAVSLLALIVSTALARYVARPLVRMRNAAEALAGGDLVARVGRLPPSLPTEIRELGSGFDAMAASLTGRHEELEELGEIARSLASTLDLQSLLPRITEAAERLVDADGVGIALVSDAGTKLRAAEYTLGMLAELAGQELPMDASVAGWVTRHGRALLIRDTRGDARARGEDVDPGIVRSVICTPLIGRSGVLGALMAVHGRGSPRVFGPTELGLLERLAGAAAVAVENARLLEAAEAASRAKSSFIATMSHELRTPLNGLLGNLELLELGIYGELSGKQREALGRMQASTQQLRTLIEEVLSFSRLESGRTELELAEVDLWEVVQGAAAIIEPLAREKGLEFSLRDESTGEERSEVFTDADRIRQILVQLGGNAVKFTEEGSVSMVLQQDSKEARVRVSDTGSGIAPADVERLFRPFEQLDAGLSRAHGGAGLGLYLAGRNAEVLGGRIVVRSEPDAGSDFTLVLPVQRAPAAPRPRTIAPGAAPAR